MFEEQRDQYIVGLNGLHVCLCTDTTKLKNYINHKMNTITIYTDGACKGNPGRGGWGAILVAPNQVHKEIYGGEVTTTNNRMEMQAVIEALRALKRPCVVHLYIDSKYVLQGMTEWLGNWKARGWLTSAKQPVKNADLWRTLDTLVHQSGHRVEWFWVKGHAGHPGNERADQLANLGVDSIQLV
jgi:ribonuclease HI